MTKKIWFLSAILAAITIVYSCKHESVNPNVGGYTPIDTQSNTEGWRCSADTVYFEYDVLPILISNCAMSGCHDASTHAEGVILTNYAKTISTADVVAGNSANSDLYKSIIKTGSNRMPPNQPLTASQIAIIKKWIDQGAKNLNCNPNFGTCDTTSIKYSAYIAPLMQNKCNGCHSGTASSGGGIALDSYAAVKAQVNNGKLWGSINFTSGYSAMPKGGQKMPTCDIDKVKAWINRGALNN